jgi:CTP synthase (UTP-ammonia lyase)
VRDRKSLRYLLILIMLGKRIRAGRSERKERCNGLEASTAVAAIFLVSGRPNACFRVQYHPEMKSRPTRPSPPFVGM